MIVADAHPLAAESSDRLSASASGALIGRIAVPGDKSISHRALILAALADGESRIEGLLEGDDVLATEAAVRAFGASVEQDGSTRIVRGCEWRSPEGVVDCGNSGTGARLLMGAAAGFPIRATFTGDASLRGRPMARVLGPLGLMGARFEGGDRLPVTLQGGSLHGLFFLNEKASAQVKSAILLAGLRAKGEVEVTEPMPSRDHTELMLQAFGCEIEIIEESGGRTVRLGQNRSLKAADVTVPGDPSSAAFPLVAALIVPGSEVIVTGMMLNPLRTGLLATLEEMGADIRIANRRNVGGEPVGDVTARASALKGVYVPASRSPSMIDEYPILAIAAACAEGTSVLHGLGELRVKESDRIEAIVAGLNACGVDAESAGDTLTVKGRGRPPASGGEVATHGDHRIAMSFLVLGLAAGAPVRVDQAGMIATSFPDFAALMGSLGARIEAAP